MKVDMVKDLEVEMKDQGGGPFKGLFGGPFGGSCFDKC